ncbi:MAG: hypothetical protein ACOC1D_00165 [Prolixibacteraceae bacterium]
MKKFILKSVSVVLAVALLSVQSISVYAGDINPAANELDESVFSFDEEALNKELSELNELDAYLAVNEEATFESLADASSPLVANIDNSAAPMGMAGQEGEPPLGIPSFLWGCVLGVVGLAVVYIMTEQDMDETKKALWGCVASTAVTVLVYMVWWGAWAAATPNYYY